MPSTSSHERDKLEDDDLDSDNSDTPFLSTDEKEAFDIHVEKSNNLTRWRIIECVSLIVFTSIQVYNPILVRLAHKEAELDGARFLGSTTVFTTEIFKTLLCSVILICTFSPKRFCILLYESVTVNRIETLKICLPALIFVIQNNLYIFALQRIDATLFSMTYQLRILSTAVLSMIILDRRFTYLQWVALLISLVGAITVQLGGHHEVHQASNHSTFGVSDKVAGITAILIMCFTNAFGGVYLEAVMKKSAENIFLQNIRLSLISLPMAGATLFSDFDAINQHGFFAGWNHNVWILVSVSAFGGIIVSAVIRYADNIKKSFCQALALGGTAIISIWLGDSNFSFYLLVGVTMVVASVVLYAVAPSCEKPNERERVFDDGDESSSQEDTLA